MCIYTATSPIHSASDYLNEKEKKKSFSTSFYTLIRVYFNAVAASDVSGIIIYYKRVRVRVCFCCCCSSCHFQAARCENKTDSVSVTSRGVHGNCQNAAVAISILQVDSLVVYIYIYTFTEKRRYIHFRFTSARATPNSWIFACVYTPSIYYALISLYTCSSTVRARVADSSHIYVRESRA